MHHAEEVPSVTVAIPTYCREQVLLDTIRFLETLAPRAMEILVLDQTPKHEDATTEALQRWVETGAIRWIRLAKPSVTHAMNVGLQRAAGDVVLFVDDDIIPAEQLIAAHARAHAEGQSNIVGGQVLQPGEIPLSEEREDAPFRFCSDRRQWVDEIMGGNFSVRRSVARRLGGFDENFVHVAFRFEAEFCDRARSAGERILFEPRASIRHLKATHGGTRAFGNHLTTLRPSHAVGAYYYLLRARNVKRRGLQMILRPLRAVRTRHHLLRPWWILGTLISELGGFVWAVMLYLSGPRLLGRRKEQGL